jgi:hypothetical protein
MLPETVFVYPITKSNIVHQVHFSPRIDIIMTNSFPYIGYVLPKTFLLTIFWKCNKLVNISVQRLRISRQKMREETESS